MIYSYKQGSNSAKELSTALETKVIKHKESKFRGNEQTVIINWGATSPPEEVKKCMIINSPDRVKAATNKLSFFEQVKDQVRVPEFTTNAEEAKEWSSETRPVVGRTILSGHLGEGIVLLYDDSWALPIVAECKLFVRYIPKKDEYRVHVVNGEVIDVRRKAAKSGLPLHHIDWKIRNTKTGFIFQKDGFTAPPDVLEQAVKAVQAVGLVFGAVDVVYNNFHEKAYVLEVNTAPGLEGSTINNYAEAFQKMFYENEVKKVGSKFKKNHYIEWAPLLPPGVKKGADLGAHADVPVENFGVFNDGF